MNVKEAVALAKQHMLDLFSDEKIRNLGLEEVEIDQDANQWVVTVGFSRPWDEPTNVLASMASSPYMRRAFKVIRISNATNQVISVKEREIHA